MIGESGLTGLAYDEVHPYAKKLKSQLSAKRVEQEANDRRVSSKMDGVSEQTAVDNSFIEVVDINKLRDANSIFFNNNTEVVTLTTNSDNLSFNNLLQEGDAVLSSELNDTFDLGIKASSELSKVDLKHQVTDKAMHFFNAVRGKVNRFFYLLDYRKRLPELKELYTYSILQSKDASYILASYGAFKAGVVGQLLFGMGVSSEELKKLRNDAIEEAFNENILMVSEILYIIELTRVCENLKANSKKLKGMYLILSKRLSEMSALGRPGFWSPLKILEERLNQLAKIETQLSSKKEVLSYKYRYYLEASKDE